MNDFYFYTETAFHHQGDKDFLRKLILASKNSGAQGVKFQVLVQPDSFLSIKHSAFKTLRSYCFSVDEWKEIFKFTADQGLDIIFMPLDIESLELTQIYKMRYIDIHPVSFYDAPLLDRIRRADCQIILGVGGRTLEEVSSALNFFGNQLSVLMVGFQAFPSDLKDVKLMRIKQLKKLFPQVQIGYADHSAYDHEHAIISNEYALMAGASVFEKHITIAEGEERVDSSSAVSEQKVAMIIKRLHYLKKNILYYDDKNSIFEFSGPEIKYRERQKKVVLKTDLPAGTVLTNMDLTTKMIDREGGFYKIDELLGKKLLIDLEKDVMIEPKFLDS